MKNTPWDPPTLGMNSKVGGRHGGSSFGVEDFSKFQNSNLSQERKKEKRKKEERRKRKKEFQERKLCAKHGTSKAWVIPSCARFMWGPPSFK